MKIAAIADPHANFVALQAIVEHVESWNPDQVVVLGDLVNRGPRPSECLKWMLEKARNHGWLLLRGNHEDYVISQAQPDAPRSGPAFEVHRPSYWTYLQLDQDVSELQEMPVQRSLKDPSELEIRFVHASMQGMRDGIYPETSESSLLDKIGIQQSNPGGAPPVVFCVGHTHRPLIREIQGVLVVNAGSSGLPFDLDVRPAYAQLTWSRGNWHAKIIRIEYNRAKAEQDFYKTGYLEEGGPLIRLVQIELATARSLLYSWAVKYQNLASAGAISVEDSVEEYISRINL